MDSIVQTANDVATVEQQIEQHAQNIERIQRDAVIEIGRELKHAQELFRFDRDEGGFEGWLNRRLPHISRSAAYNAVQMFNGIGKYPELWTLSDAAKLQASTAEPDVKAIIAERVAAGEVFTAAQVKEIKATAAQEAIAQINADAEQGSREIVDRDVQGRSNPLERV